MGTLSLTDPVNEVATDATLIASNNAAIKAVVNGGIDDSNVNASAGINASKLALAYTIYTPTWTSSGTAPAIDNSTVTAAYARLGKVIHAYGQIVFGSGATYGTGNYAFALPAGPAVGVTIGTAYMNHSSGAMAHGAVRVGTFGPPGTMVIQFGATYLGTNTQVGQTTPWTWVANDILEWNIIYQSV